MIPKSSYFPGSLISLEPLRRAPPSHANPQDCADCAGTGGRRHGSAAGCRACVPLQRGGSRAAVEPWGQPLILKCLPLTGCAGIYSFPFYHYFTFFFWLVCLLFLCCKGMIRLYGCPVAESCRQDPESV